MQKGNDFARAAIGAEDGGAAAQNALHGMLTGQGVSRFFPQHLGKACCPKETQKGLIGENNLLGMIEDQNKIGKSVQDVQQLTVADRFGLVFDFNLRAAWLPGCFGRAEVISHVGRQSVNWLGFVYGGILPAS